MASNKNAEKTPEQVLQDQIRADKEYIIKNKRIRRQTRRRAVIIILLIFLLIIALLAGATYAIMRFVDESNFRVSVTQTGTQWLSLSNDYAFSNGGTSVLDISAPKNMDNITLCNTLDEMLPDIVAQDGLYSGKGSEVYYIASTFYLTNSGTKDAYYEESITLERALRNMDKAIRIILIRDKDPTDDDLGEIVAYAAYATDADGNTIYDANGNPVREEVVPTKEYKAQQYPYFKGFTFDQSDFTEGGVWLAKPFAGEGYVHKSQDYPIAPGQKIKYTVLIWLEGYDPQCVGNNDSLVDSERGILGGQVKIAVEFATVNNVEIK